MKKKINVPHIQQLSDTTKTLSDEKINQIKNTLWDMALVNMLALDEQTPVKKVSDLQFPEVMGLEGKPVRADKLIMQYDEQIAKHTSTQLMHDSNGGSSIGGLGANQFLFNRVNQLLIDNIFLGYAEYSLLMQNGILSSICSTPADKMTSEWIEFVSIGEQNDNTKFIEELEFEFERLNVKDTFNQAARFTFGMGGCLVYPHLKGNMDDNEMYNELIIDSAKIGIGDLEYIKLIEPIWYVPIRYVTDNPFSKWFYVPEYYAVMGKICHSTRVLKFMYNEAPNIIKSQYNFNGIPVMQQSIPYVMNFETMRTTIVEIVQSLNMLVLKTGLQAIANGVVQKNPDLNTNAGAALGSRLKAMTATRNNLGVMAIDFNGEDLYNLSMQLQTLDKLWSQSAEFMCIVPKIPATELLGISPQGFNSTGDGERKRYVQQIGDWQEKIFTQNLTKVMHLAMLNIWGEIKKDITFQYKKLDTANELEASTISVNKMTEATGYLDRGIVTAEEVRAKMAHEKDSGWNELEELQEEEENAVSEKYPKSENLSGGNYGEENNPYNNPSNATGPAI